MVGESAAGECVLIMIDDRQWDGSQQRLNELTEKINTYLHYVLSGQLIKDFPNMEGKPIRFQLDSATEPDAPVRKALEQAGPVLLKYGVVDIRYNVR